MQIKNETRVLTNYPAYKISTNGSVYKIADLTTDSEVNTMKKPDSRGLARIRLYKDGKSYKETVQDLLLSVFTEEEIFGDGKSVFDTDETDDLSEDDTEFLPYPDNREVWIDGNLITVNEKLVADYLHYLPLPLYKNPCFPYMTEKEQDNYNNLRDYRISDVYKYI